MTFGHADAHQSKWRYVQIAIKFLFNLLRRDVSPPPELVKFILDQTLNPQPPIRNTSQRYDV